MQVGSLDGSRAVADEQPDAPLIQNLRVDDQLQAPLLPRVEGEDGATDQGPIRSIHSIHSIHIQNLRFDEKQDAHLIQNLHVDDQSDAHLIQNMYVDE